MSRYVLFVFFIVFSSCQKNEKDTFINSLIEKMTLEEKIGQLTQLPGGRRDSPNSRISEQTKNLIRSGKVGSFLHVMGAEFLKELQSCAVKESRLGIPLIFAMDNLHGFRTIFPVPLAWASSWDPEAVKKATRIAAEEATSAGLHWTFAPMVDIARDPRWGRIVEGAGEDPYLGSVMASAEVEGFQTDDLGRENSLVACAKHYVGYGAAIGGRDYNSVDVSLSTIYEIYLPPFHAAVNAGVGTIMSGFHDLNGIPMSVYDELLNGVLRYNWGFRGFVVSDWNAIQELLNHGVVLNRSEAAKKALEAGVDMDMTSMVYQSELPDLIQNGKVVEKLVDRAVRRILSIKYDLGLFDDPYRYCNPVREKNTILKEEFLSYARNIARKSIVLLKNEKNLLPFKKTMGNLAVIGRLATDRRSPMGAWKGFGKEEDVITVLEGIKKTVSKSTRVSFAEGYSFNDKDPMLLRETLRIAEQSDAVILVLGEHSDMSGEARSRSDIALPDEQELLADAVLALNKPVAVVLMNGRPLAIDGIAEKACAILETWYLGVRMGDAVADVLFGDYNPGGKLPVTFPRSTGQIPVYYNHYNTGRPASEDLNKDSARYFDLPIQPLYAFGYGLSYTEFKYGDLETVINGDTAFISLKIRNEGACSGEEVVQLYVRDLVARKSRPIKALKGFMKLNLNPGETKTAKFALPLNILGYYDNYLLYWVEKGAYKIMIGSSSDDIRLESTIMLEKDLSGIDQNKLGFTRVAAYADE